jgi:hypothetical protein
MKLELKPPEIEHPIGLEITVEGFAGDTGSVKPSQVFIELYEGNLRVHVWNGNDEDPTASVTIPHLPNPSPPAEVSDR